METGTGGKEERLQCLLCAHICVCVCLSACCCVDVNKITSLRLSMWLYPPIKGAPFLMDSFQTSGAHSVLLALI